MSLRIALKRSLDLNEKMIAPEVVVTPTKGKEIMKKQSSVNNHRRRGRPPAALTRTNYIIPTSPVVELPQIDNCIRNIDPSMINDFGFVEISGLLSEQLLDEVRQEAIDKVTRYLDRGRKNSPKAKKQRIEEISNSLQVEVSTDLLNKIGREVHASDIANNAMRAVFGGDNNGGGLGRTETNNNNYNGFVIETPKFLVTLPGSNPQLPHADDHCNSCIMGLIHLRDNQVPTLAATYDGRNKDYPTGITVSCNTCNRTQMLPDRDFRRGVHLTDEEWNCADCTAPVIPYNFEGSMVKSFGELLDSDALSLCHSYCGKKDVNAGDGVFTLPTLIHRGPGCPSTATENRYMLFFTLRPQYNNTTTAGVDEYHKYNPDLQIHAPCILFNQFMNVKSIYDESGCNLDGYISTIVGKKTASLMREVAQLNAEVKHLKTKIHHTPTNLHDEN
jgi:hypothetical protein